MHLNCFYGKWYCEQKWNVIISILFIILLRLDKKYKYIKENIKHTRNRKELRLDHLKCDLVVV